MAGFLTQPSPSNQSEVQTTEAAEPVTEKPTEKPEVWYAFYNPSLLRDNDATNDYYFGYNPNLVNEYREVEYYHNDVKNRMMIDPALAAAEMGAVDALIGTRFIGDDYDKSGGNWLNAINLAKTRFMEMDKTTYLTNLDKFFEFLNSGNRDVQYRHGIHDQLYMNPFTSTGVPDVIVMDSGDGEGWCLVYTFYTNAQPREVVLRINCGYPPVNIADVMKTTPQVNPVPQPTTVPETTPTPETTTEPTTKEPETTTKEPETTTQAPEKEPEAASYENVEPNNDKSSYEQSQNSGNYSSYDEYRAQMDDLSNNPAGEWGGPLD
ncbi:MAG: hypothetical protein Q4A70_01570 [Candidatus Saccharibacteria bacterium]|nr:hypothetical protein [Candidatus Saccharibacteria bacterium]